MGIKFCNVNKADVVRILFGQIYNLTVEQQPCLGSVPPVINVHPGLCFPSGQCPAACLCWAVSRSLLSAQRDFPGEAGLQSHGPAGCVEVRQSEQPNLGEQPFPSTCRGSRRLARPLCSDSHHGRQCLPASACSERRACGEAPSVTLSRISSPLPCLCPVYGRQRLCPAANAFPKALNTISLLLFIPG